MVHTILDGMINPFSVFGVNHADLCDRINRHAQGSTNDGSSQRRGEVES